MGRVFRLLKAVEVAASGGEVRIVVDGQDREGQSP